MVKECYLKAPELTKGGLVDEEEVYRMFGGYLPVERTTDCFFFKTPRQLGAQREENAHTKHSNIIEKRYIQIPFKNRDKGAR